MTGVIITFCVLAFVVVVQEWRIQLLSSRAEDVEAYLDLTAGSEWHKRSDSNG